MPAAGTNRTEARALGISRRSRGRLATLLLGGCCGCGLLRPDGDAITGSVESAAAESITVTPWVRLQSLQLESSSDVFITSGGAPGSATSIEPSGALGVDGATASAVGIDLVWGDRRLRLGYEAVPLDGTSTLDDPVIFNGVTFPAGAQTRTSLDLDFVTLGYDSRVWHDDDAALRIGGEVFVWSFDMSMDAAGAGLSANRSFTHALPALTASWEQRCFEDWRFSTDLTAGLLASDRSIFDLQAGFGTLLWKRLHLDVGFRYWELQFHETSNKGDLTAYGPFIAASMLF